MPKNYATQFIGKIVTVNIDRPLGSKHPKWGFEYQVNYGEIPDTVAPDGEGIDAYVLGVFEPLERFSGRCIAVVRRQDDDDDKLVVVPEGQNFTDEEILNLVEFQECFFKPAIVRS